MFCQLDVTLWGLDISLRTMRRGEFSRFLLQPRYAYGELGCPPIIPPGATVLYEVQVFDYLDSAKVDEFFALSLVSFVQYVFSLLCCEIATRFLNFPCWGSIKVDLILCLDSLDKLLKAKMSLLKVRSVI